MPLNPIAFTNRVVASFLRYQLTAYPFADRRLDKQMRDLLSLDKTRATPLLKGPYLTLSLPFEKGCTVQRLIEESLLHPLMRERIPASIENVYKHQEEAIRSIASGKTTLISTGTGSGKTECFLYPVISKCLQLAASGEKPGISAVLVYPMNSLAEDQLLRLRSLLAGTGITFGMYVGKTPRRRADVSGIRLPRGASSADYERSLADEKQRGSGQTVHPAEEICSREEMRTLGEQPRILLTNVNQLELLLTRQQDIELFADVRLDYLVFDEAHTFTGAQGAETACLIRRLLQYCGRQPRETRCVATSATIVDPKDPSAAVRFASRFFGVPTGEVVTIGESYSALPWPENRWSTNAPSNSTRVLEECVAAVGEEVPTERKHKIQNAFKQLSARELPDTPDVEECLHGALQEAEAIFRLAELLKRPLSLADTAIQLGVSLGRACTEEEVLSWLTLGAAAAKEGRPLVRPVVHAFLRGIGGATVAFPSEDNAPVLHFSAESGEVKADPFRMPLATCTTCGQHYFSTHLHDFQHIGSNVGGGQAAGDQRYWQPLEVAKGGKRCILVDALVSGETFPADKVVEVKMCRHCGTLHELGAGICLHCGRPDPKVTLFSIRTNLDREGYLSSCLGCGATGRAIGNSFREPARPVRTTNVADIHVLAQDMINNLDPRRLLVFCDNRQDAAFQAGWMRDHARRFRLRSIIAEALTRNPQGIGVGDLTQSLSDIFKDDEALSHALLPEVWRVASKGAEKAHAKEREKFLRMAILREVSLSPRQVLGLEPWGRMRVKYDGLTENLPFVVSLSKRLGLPPEAVCDGVTTLLDHFRRHRILFDEVHQTFSKYWNDGDPEVQNGYLPSMDPPTGTKLELLSGENSDYAMTWIPKSGDTFVKQAVRKWGVADADLLPLLGEVFAFFKSGGWLAPVTLLGAKGTALPGQSGLFQVAVSKLRLFQSQGVWRCKRCSRRSTRPTPHKKCPAYRCTGTLEHFSENTDDYNLSLLDGQYDLIRPEEHTAMVPHDKRERIENWFKDPKSPRVNTLVCTQTLEMGVDIGALDAVLMRNVPPLPANYWQRVGRAGRRNRMAVDVTYCRDISHDRAYFKEPEKLLGGRVDAPTFNLSNELMVRRHIHATVITRLQRAALADQGLKATLDEAFPTFVRSWLFEADGEEIRKRLPDLRVLEGVVSSTLVDLLAYAKSVFAVGWPIEDAAAVTDAQLERAIKNFVPELRAVMQRIQKRLHWAHRTITRLNTEQQKTGTLDRLDEATRKRCEMYIKRIKGEIGKKRSEAEGQDDSITYSVLAREGFLPGYGLERGSILGTGEIPYWETGEAGDLLLPRPPLIALREYVPGNLIYANGHRFVVRKYQLEPPQDRESSPYLEVAIGRSAIREVAGGGGSGGTQVLPSLPVTDVELSHASQISDEEDYRFQMGVAVLGYERKRHSGGSAYSWGWNEVHLIKGMHLRLANVGAKTEIQKRINFGYLLCSVCGHSVSPMASDAQKVSFRDGHKERCGGKKRDVALEYALHTDTVADVLKFTRFANQGQAYSVLESLRMAAANRLEMVLEDLQILVIGNVESDEVTGYLLDPMPGGSGLLEQLVGRFEEVRTEAIQIARDCPSACPSSCTDCLQNYRNSFYHQFLDRHASLSFLEPAPECMRLERPVPPLHGAGTEPMGADAPVNSAERRLRHLLLAAGFPEASEWQQVVPLPGGLSTTPDAVYRPDDDDLRPVAIYLDGMSAHLHGNPATAEKDRVVREALKQKGWEVLAITAHDLRDIAAMRRHFRNLAHYLELSQLRKQVAEQSDWYADEYPAERDSAAGEDLGYEYDDLP
jgi:ATP-dependent helicase YprA (DUF1998 family)